MSPSPPPVPGDSQQGAGGGGEGRYDEEEEEEDISPDLWQEACWIVIRSIPNNAHSTEAAIYVHVYKLMLIFRVDHALICKIAFACVQLNCML